MAKSSTAPRLTSRQRIQKLHESGHFEGIFSKRLKLPEGDTIVRVLPPAGCDPYKDFFIERRVHWINKRSIICPKSETDRNQCSMCDRANSYQNSGDEDDQKLGKEIAARTNFLMRVVTFDKKTRE